MLNWTVADIDNAHAQGWLIADGDNGSELQRVDETEILASDDAAWDKVVAAAFRGDGLALRALAFIRNHGPEEYAAIIARCGDPWYSEIKYAVWLRSWPIELTIC